jgi:hypothetical protein
MQILKIGSKEKKIIEYLEQNKNNIIYPVDIADFYNWDAWETFIRTQKMKKKGLIV